MTGNERHTDMMRWNLSLIAMLLMVGCSARPRTLTVAVVSMESHTRQTQQNLERIEYWARRAAAERAELVLFPEAALSGWWASRQVRAYGEPVNGPSIQRLIQLAGRLKITIAVGMTERDGDKAYITHVLLNGHGVIGIHRKSTLAPGEEKTWDSGNDAGVFDVKGVKVGFAICYESVHPATCAKLKANGAEVILAPYANGTDPNELLNGKRPYTYARARENGVWYVACDAPPRDEKGVLRRGAAYVINPQGELVALTSPRETGESMVVHSITLPARATKP